jgi:ComF family protein
MFLFEKITSLLFPDTCVVCNKTPQVICTGCTDSLDKSFGGMASSEFIQSVFCYSDVRVKKLIWRLKYKNSKTVANLLGQTMYQEVLVLIEELVNYRGLKTLHVIPIPLHQKRLRERGYNQSLLLAQKLCKSDDTKVCLLDPFLLVRTKTSTPNARTHSREERIKNTKGSFAVNTQIDYKGKTILLVDDVYTTGATISEARKVLLRAGALDVYAITLAH